MRRRPISLALAGSLALDPVAERHEQHRLRGSAATGGCDRPRSAQEGDRRRQGRRGHLGRPERLRGSGCGCSRTAATPSTRRWPPRPRWASPSPTAPASVAAATSSTTTRSPAGCTPSTAARPPRARCPTTRSSTPRPASPTTRSPRTWSPAGCRSACPAPPPPGPPPWTGGARRDCGRCSRRRPGSPNAGSWSTRPSGSRRRTTRRGLRRSPRAGRCSCTAACPRWARASRTPPWPAPTARSRRTRSSSTAGRCPREIVDAVRHPPVTDDTTLPVPPGFMKRRDLRRLRRAQPAADVDRLPRLPGVRHGAVVQRRHHGRRGAQHPRELRPRRRWTTPTRCTTTSRRAPWPSPTAAPTSATRRTSTCRCATCSRRSSPTSGPA